MKFSAKAFPYRLGGITAATLGLLFTAAGTFAETPAASFPPDQIEFFEKNVRPILADNCYDCHGSHRHENGLRLDSRDAILRGSDYGVIAQAGNPAASKILKAIKHVAGVEAMPKKADKLSDLQIANIEKWIALGLPWPKEVVAETHAEKPSWEQHWAFQPIKEPAAPKVDTSKFKTQTKLDVYVAAKLADKGLDFAPAADRAILGRRLYLDLTGLLPSYEDLQAYIKDSSPNATEKLIDKLLESPNYGERWGRHWLDLARYSDTVGYTAGGVDNRFPHAYTFRDWVIEALNKDLPYDQFIMQQLAADRMLEPGKVDKSLAALGFLTIGDRFLGDRLLQNDDRIDVVTRGMMGLTVACARCHDHKYDPIPSKDYYALYSVFNSSEQPEEMPVIGYPSNGPSVTEYQSQVGAIQKEMLAFREEVFADIRKGDRLREYLIFARKSKAWQNEQFRGEAGKAKLRDRFASSLRDLIDKHAGAAKPHPVMLAWRKFADLPDGEFAAKAPAVVAELTKPDALTNPVVRNELAKRPAPRSFDDVARLYSDVFLTCLSGKEPDNADWQAMRTLLMDGRSPMSVPVDQVDRFFTRKDTERMTQMRNKITKLDLTSPGAPQRAMVMVDKEKPADGRVMIRGNPGRLGDPAPRAYLTMMGGQKFTSGSGRLELAKLIASRDNPLTARVLVNRVWLDHFGKPLVSQTSDFGVQTPKPEQAELLDYLSATFMDQGWSLKKLHREILNSRTYQQSAMVTPAKEAKDPENAFLSRFNRQRLDYETMRDTLLQVSGKLDPANKGGRSVPLETQEADTRRSVYLLVDRYEQATVPAMFDFANPDSHSPQRFVTTVPQQTLFLMNSPFMKTRADQLAGKIPVQGSSVDSETLKALYRKVLLREPTAAEVELAGRFINDSTQMQMESPYSWQYGYGELTPAANGQAVKLEFIPFKVFKNDKKVNARWQGGQEFPDKVLSHLNWIRSSGQLVGHPGPGNKADVLRWVAPNDATIRIDGTVTHGSPRGNGIRVWILSNRDGVLLEKQVLPAQSVPIQVATLKVKKGDILDFCATNEGSTDSDGFKWTPSILRQDSPVTGFTLWTDAARDFAGPDKWPLNLARPQTPLSQITQVLLMSNEFQFVD